MKKMHLSVRLLSLLLVLTLLWGVAAPADASGVGSPLEALVPEETPTVGIGYMEEVLKNLVEEATYRIQGSAYQANASGKISLEEAWIGSTISIVKVGDQVATSDSEPQFLTLSGRGDAPTGITPVHETVAGKNDGMLSGTTPMVQYRAESETSWKICGFGSTRNLAAGIYYVRYRSDGTRFASNSAVVEILPGEPAGLNVTAPEFAAVGAGYAQPAPQEISIRNTGSAEATISSVTLAGANPDCFTVEEGNATVAASGTNTSYQIQPHVGLEAGTYSAQIVVTYDGGNTATADVIFLVGASTAPPTILDPDAPQNLEELQAADPREVAGLSKFDGRSYGIITPVRDQGSSNLCWAYASVNASEASILREGIDPGATADTLRFSPTHLGYIRFNRGPDLLGNTSGEGDPTVNWLQASGAPNYSATLFSQWWGPVQDGTPMGNTPGVIEEHTNYRLEQAIELDGQRLRSDPDARARMKEAIVQYGAVTFSYNWIHEVPYDNPSRGGAGNPHACVIIGWDDTIPASLFSGGASQDGGWLVKNSYSSLPYFYLSYDNNSGSVFAFDYAMKEEYDFNYFYDASTEDFGMAASLNYTCAANVFQGQKGSDSATEYVKAVQVGFYGSGATCEVKVYTDLQDQQDMTDLGNVDPTQGTLAASGTATFDRPGYHTVPLEQLAEVAPGSYFSVVVQISGGNNPYLRVIRATDCKSYVLSRYGTWSKSGLNVPRLKAYTVLEDGASSLTPEAVSHTAIRYGAEALTNLAPKVTYLVNDVTATATEEGVLALQTNWLGTAHRQRGHYQRQ